MMVLIIGLYVEGNTDEKLLPLLVQRTAQKIIDARKHYDLDVLEPIVLNDKIDVRPRSFINCVVAAARYAAGYHLIILHRDADHAKPEKTMKKYILPACVRVQQEKDQGANVCQHIVPLIPIREIEAWLLVDPIALVDALHVNMNPDELGLPNHGHQIEALPDPKQTLNQIIARHASHADLLDFYENLAATIRLDRLEGLSSYRTFVKALTNQLVDLGIII